MFMLLDVAASHFHGGGRRQIDGPCDAFLLVRKDPLGTMAGVLLVCARTSGLPAPAMALDNRPAAELAHLQQLPDQRIIPLTQSLWNRSHRNLLSDSIYY